MSDQPPIRHIHLGLGSFHRAHQAAYVHDLNQLHPEDPHGIAAFTLQRPQNVFTLKAQHYRYTLVERGPETDQSRVITSIVNAEGDANHDALLGAFADPKVTVVTTTASNPFYYSGPDDGPDLSNPLVVGDVRRLEGPGRGAPLTAAARIVDGLRGRHAKGLSGLSVVSCDRGRNNGAELEATVIGIASQLTRDLGDWIASEVKFVATVADRWVPRVSADETDVAARPGGWADAVPVIAEPYSSWFLSGDVSQLPDWRQVGAEFVPEIEPYRERRDWLAGAARLILSALGERSGHHTLDEAFRDAHANEIMGQVWERAALHLRPVVAGADYLDRLRERLANRRLAYPLEFTFAPHIAELTMMEPIRLDLAAGRPLNDGQYHAAAAWVWNALNRGKAADVSSAMAMLTDDAELAAALTEPVARIIKSW